MKATGGAGGHRTGRDRIERRLHDGELATVYPAVRRTCRTELAALRTELNRTVQQVMRTLERAPETAGAPPVRTTMRAQA